MKFETLLIENVGAFRSASTIQYHNELNVFTGLNGSGKSLTLLAPYAMLRHAANPGVDCVELSRLSNYCRSGSNIVLNSVDASHRSRLRVAWSASHFKNLILDTSLFDLTSERLRSHLGAFDLREVESSVIYIDPARGGFVEQNQDGHNPHEWRFQSTHERFRKLRSFMKLINDLPGNFWESVQDRMRRFFSEDSNHLLVPSRSRSIVGTSKLATNVSSFGANHEIDSSASGGTEALFIVAETTNIRNSVIIIDTPEAHLHPRAQEMMADYLSFLTTEEGGRNQIIIATHSMSLIYKLRNGTVYNIRREDNQSRIERIIENGTPQREYEHAMNDLGNCREAFVRMRNFYRDFVQNNNLPEPQGGWVV